MGKAGKYLLLFGFETWVLTPRLEKALAGFHHWAAWRIAGMGPKRHPDRTWVYPPIGEALEMVGLEEIGAYISRRHNTVTQYIATHTIMELCLAAERKLRMCLSRKWWEHPELDIMDIRVGKVSTEGRE